MAEEQTESKTTKPNWVKMGQKELETLVIDLGKKGETPSKIGNLLRDKHGIPKAKLLGKKISQILKENKIDYKTEKLVMEDKIKNLESHIKKHKHDKGAKRSFTKSLWAVKKLQ